MSGSSDGTTTPTREPHLLAVVPEVHLLDASSEPAFAALVQAARQLVEAPVAAIMMVAETHVDALVSVGLPLGVQPREEAFCPHALAAGEDVFEVPDTWSDARFSSLPMATGESAIRFYAGVPLRIEGSAVGTLCVMDHRPRNLTTGQRDQLRGLAGVAAALIGQHHARQALSLQIDRMMDLTRASGDWMWETDEQGRYRWISGDFERLTGLQPGQCIGQMVADEPLVDTAGDVVAGATTLLDHLRGRRAFSRLATRMQSAGGPRYVSRSAIPVFDAHGEFRGFRGTARDVTARKLAAQARREHEALRRQMEVVERAARHKSEFLSRASHELRTPLNAILGFAQLMVIDTEHPLPLAQRARLDGVRQAGQALLQLIDQLLEVTRDATSPGSQSSAQAPVGDPDGRDGGGHGATAGRPPRTVLYVEDEPLNIVLMQEIFRGQAGWELHVARDGTEGVAMAQALKPDLALIDMNLPDFNGIEVLRRLRADASLQATRCIALSADAMAEQIAAARAAGFEDYWTKPIDLSRLLSAIAQAIDGGP